MPLRAFFVLEPLRPAPMPTKQWRCVAMPLRAFFVLEPHVQIVPLGCLPVASRNALAGIFCFGTCANWFVQIGQPINRESQCPCGHFLFWNTPTLKPGIRVGFGICSSQCPCGHFLFWNTASTLNTSDIHACGPSSRNALAGIFCFGTPITRDSKGLLLPQSQCPCGHFLFWNKKRDQCCGGDLHIISRNALAGIFCFGTLLRASLAGNAAADGSQCPCGHFLFWNHGLCIK